MAIDIDSPTGQVFKALAEDLYQRRRRLDVLAAYFEGNPPLPEGMENLRDVARDFFRTSRTNFAELICEATRERLKPTGVRTAADDDEGGDDVAWSLWTAAKLPIVSADVHQSMLSLGDGYSIVSWSAAKQRPVVTAEDPRQVITHHDPLTDDVIAALKLYRDEQAGVEVAWIYTPGRVRVATRSTKRSVSSVDLNFKANDWDWDETRSADLPAPFADVVPVVRFSNRDGVAEFERHVDLLDRINRTLLRGLVIMTFQAFKQRAISGDLPEFDTDGKRIDYNSIFKAGPDALWLMPPDASIWESGQVDINPLLNFVKNDVLFLAAVTRTPMSMFTPDASTQSAEGASLQREGLVFKAEDRIARVTSGWAEVLSLMLRLTGDTDRADVTKINLLWAPVERFSISERANAIAQTKGVVSRRQQLIEIWGMSPDQAERTLSELVDDQLMDAQFAAVARPPAPTVTQVPADQPAIGSSAQPAPPAQ